MKEPAAVSVIDPNYPTYKDDEDLLTNLRNIRIVKFALSHFHRIYEACEGFLQGEERTTVGQFLLSLWASTVGLSVEYKRNRLTYKDKEQFVDYVDLNAIDWHLDDGNNEAEDLFEEKEDGEDKKNEEERKRNTYSRVTHIFQKLVLVSILTIFHNISK